MSNGCSRYSSSAFTIVLQKEKNQTLLIVDENGFSIAFL
ncbi:hypothetical protein J768_2785 [Acinetobacter baumannii 25307_5]|nr:hypothetical protein J706_0760 [Acinetobacter baumannii 1488685]EXQ97797.1 hypothetical protein J666_2861 [Acinetobacter baumannii 1237202]EXT78960.1 hypothetical protein J768_2785 [Acinetobacter baumannii 25307_5]EXU41403.1 hypothetical protein J759_2524 [Acinetobacter baumannii 24845_6]